jgi:NAD(P)-dependent dehydrogenase (short-subunit alcohol dehydrogenase family)
MFEVMQQPRPAPAPIPPKLNPSAPIIAPAEGQPIAMVTGGANGLGREIVLALKSKGFYVVVFDTVHGDDVREPGDIGAQFSKLGIPERLDVLVNCAGVNRIDWLDKFTDRQWDEVMDVNAKGIFMMTKACLSLLCANVTSAGTVLNIVSNASHMPMTCSAAYNASKGAAHILTQQLARELTRKYGITVFGISPNKLAGTPMSRAIEEQVVATRGWTPEQAKLYQLSSLLAGETPPARVAEFIAFLLSEKERHRYLTGCVLPYGA